MKYAALSYVWGSFQPYMTTTRNYLLKPEKDTFSNYIKSAETI